MATKRATIADVAARAGLSATAVSRVLNNHANTRLSEEAVARIKAAAAELDYRPNLTARALSTRKSQAVGFVSDLVATERFASMLIPGAMNAARFEDHMLLITETEGLPDVEARAVEGLVDREVDGIVFATSRAREFDLPAAAARTRFVLVNAVSPSAPTAVLPDEFDGGRRIVQLLADAGHRDGVAIIGRTRDEPADEFYTVLVQRRMAGIWDALLHNGIEPIAEITCRRWELDQGYDATVQLLEAGVPIRAIIALNDRIAFGAYRALGERGLSVPDDVSVVSFDDDVISTFLKPMLTTVAIPYYEMGYRSVQLLLDETSSPGEHLIHMPIRERGSVARATAHRGAP